MNSLPNFLSLFKETKNDAGKKNIFVDKNAPRMACPSVNSKVHKDDINYVMFYLNNKSLSDNFLKLSDDSCKSVFKKFCKDNNLKVDWKKIKPLLKDLNKATFGLKSKYKRERPKYYIQNIDSEIAKNIQEMDSYSFPSGHTTTAYFLAGILSKLYPNYSSDFENIAMLIGHSRIENGVHYPSDVTYGRLLGEYFSNQLNDNNVEHKHFKKKDRKKFTKFLLGKYDNKKDLLHDLVDYIIITNKIEGIDINYRECANSCKSFLMGYEIEDSCKDENVATQLKMMIDAYMLNDVNSIGKFQHLHSNFKESQLNNCKPGHIRAADKRANYGNSYSRAEDIVQHCKKINHIDNPFVKHIAFEWIHPFNDGNGRLGRIILLSDLNFDLNKVLDFIDKDYIETIENFIDTNRDIDNILF